MLKSPYVCAFCDKEFQKVICLDQHISENHDISELSSEEDYVKYNQLAFEPFQCGLCQARFSVFRRDDLVEHVIKKHDKTFICQLCDKRFKTSYDLQRHCRDVHLDERPFQCQKCEKAFKRRWHLMDHQSVHSREKPYQCPIRYGHSDERPFQCQKCEKAFKRRHHLKDHQSVHSREKPYQCPICDKCFKTPRTLGCHRNLHNE